MDAVADMIPGSYGSHTLGPPGSLPVGFEFGTVGTEVEACTNTACNGNGSDAYNSYVGNQGGAGGVTAAAAAEFSSNGVPAPAVASAQADINNLSMSVSSGNPAGSNGSGEAFAAFTDVLTFSQFQGVIDPFFQLSLDPSLSQSGGATYMAQLSVYWYGPGTLDAQSDSPCVATSLGDPSCNVTSSGAPGTRPTGFFVPALTDADTLIVFMSLYGDASSGGAVSDPASVMISSLPAGVSVISEGGATYTASPTAVPEPACWTMMASVAALLWIGRRRRSAKRAPTY